MGSYYGAGNTAGEMVDAEKWAGISLGSYGDSVNVSDDVDLDVLLSFARTMFQRALRAEDAVQMFSDTAQRNVDARNTLATLFGEAAKQAAREQEWCDEYEKWTEKIRETLQMRGFYSEAAHYGDAAERRDRYTITVEFLARNGYSAQDFTYTLQNAAENGHNYGCKIVDTSDATLVPAIVDDENDDN